MSRGGVSAEPPQTASSSEKPEKIDCRETVVVGFFEFVETTNCVTYVPQLKPMAKKTTTFGGVSASYFLKWLNFIR